MGMFRADNDSYDIDEDYILTYLDDIIKDAKQVPIMIGA